jgi:tRNA threonylcarbamoyladenosine biosynthesis protein TsaE
MNPRSHDLTAFEAAGEQLGRELPAGSVVWLEGPLGAGKTTLVRAIARGRGVIEPATSPTYNLVHHYQSSAGSVYHVDCYRLRHPEEAADLDWATLVESDLLLIEWPERAGAWAPAPTTAVRVGVVADFERRTLELR